MKVKISEVFRNLSVTKRVILGSITLLVMGYMFCLPRQLFHVPYSTVVTARNEELLGARIASDGQWRFPPRNTTPEKIKHCLITFEDKHFYHHWGVNPLAIGRAVYQNIKNKGYRCGAIARYKDIWCAVFYDGSPENLTRKQKFQLVVKEVKTGSLNGALLGIMALLCLGVYVHLFKGYTWMGAFGISGCVGVSLLVAMAISSAVGTVIPMFFHKIKVDPAVASGPLITTVNDLVAVVTYYGMAWLLLIR